MVSSVPGALAAEVRVARARETSPRRTLAHASARRCSRKASLWSASVTSAAERSLLRILRSEHVVMRQRLRA